MKKKFSFPSWKIATITGLWVFIILFIVLINRAMPSVDSQALKYYSEGSYRHSVEILSGKLFLSGLETYLMARDYQELSQWEKALEYYRKVKTEDLSGGGLKEVFLDNYGYYYSRAIYTAILNQTTNTNSFDLDAGMISNVWSQLNTNSFAYDTVTGMHCYFGWLKGGYDYLTNESAFPRTNQTTRMFRAASRYFLGDKTRLAEVFDSKSVKYLPLVVRDLSNRIAPEDFLSFDMNQLANAFLYYLDIGMYSNADVLLKMHFGASGDKDFFIRNRSLSLFRQGKRGEAVGLLTDLYKNGLASEGSLSLLVGFLMKMESYNAVFDLLKTVAKKNASYSDELVTAMGKLGKFDELYNWYAGAGEAFPRDSVPQVFNMMMQKGEAYARKMAYRAPGKDKDYFLVYAKSLFEMKDGKTNDAYGDLLDVTLNSPFTYEWVVAKNYEKELRSNYMTNYTDALTNSLSFNLKRSVQDKASYYLALPEIDAEYFKTVASNKELLDSVSNVRSTVDQSLTNISREFSDKLERVRGLAKDWVGGFNQEVMNLIDRDPDSSNDRYKMVYLYQGWLEGIGNEGLVVFRLNYFLTKILGGRRYHPLLKEDAQRSLYPVKELDVIETSVADTNAALWILSAFREESHFNKDALSSSGAVGITQLMPKTADILKKNIKHENWDIYDYRDNIAIGVYHLQYLFKKYKDNYYRALAAYNAGETIVNRWGHQYDQPVELWLECLDYDETRNYVKKIVLTRFFYDWVYRKK